MAVTKEANEMELVISNYIRNEYENKFNKHHVPMALKHLMIKFSRKVIGCSLLTNKEDLDFIQSLPTKLLNTKKFHLLFKASDYQFSANMFHSICDNKGATITIAKSDHGNIFGGYTSKSWSSNNGAVKDEDAFLFLIKSNDTLTQKECPLIFKIKADKTMHAIWDSNELGPVFGDGYDLSIYDSCHEKEEDSKWFCCHAMYDYTGYEDVNLCGGTTFKVMEYQVFQVK